MSAFDPQFGRPRVLIPVLFGALVACGSPSSADGEQASTRAEKPSTASAPEPARPAKATARAKVLDLDGDGREDRVTLLSSGEAAADARAVAFADGGATGASGGEGGALVSLGNGQRWRIDLPFATATRALREGGAFPAEAVLCWPVAAGDAVQVVSEEGTLTVWWNGRALVAEPCGA